MKPAGLVWSRRLYLVSNWREHTPVFYLQDLEGDNFRRVSADMYEYMLMNGYAPFEEVPAYDLGFILQAIVDHSSLESAGVLRMLADYVTEGESFADAACRLAVHLFEDGILEREQ